MKIREGYDSEQVRNQALYSILDDLNNRQRAVFNIIKEWQPVSAENIAQHLNAYPHTITPRILELREMGLIRFAKEGYSERSKRKVSLWEVSPQPKQLTLF